MMVEGNGVLFIHKISLTHLSCSSMNVVTITTFLAEYSSQMRLDSLFQY